MYCGNCKKRIIIKRTLLTLFETKKSFICESCQKSFPIKLSLTKFPLENYELTILSLLENGYSFNFDVYTEEISKVFLYFYKRYKDYFIVYLDKLYLNDLEIIMLSFLADIEKKPLLLICGSMRK